MAENQTIHLKFLEDDVTCTKNDNFSQRTWIKKTIHVAKTNCLSDKEKVPESAFIKMGHADSFGLYEKSHR